MQLACPQCHSEEVRLSRRKVGLRKILRVFGIYHFRCEPCGHLFVANIHDIRHALYAKCDLCHRMDLSRWNRDHYDPPFWTKVMLALGARAVRCEYCRNNFWSFRPIKERYSREKRAARSQVIVPAQPSPARHEHESFPVGASR